jgi:hypothetical protein
MCLLDLILNVINVRMISNIDGKFNYLGVKLIALYSSLRLQKVLFIYYFYVCSEITRIEFNVKYFVWSLMNGLLIKCMQKQKNHNKNILHLLTDLIKFINNRMKTESEIELEVLMECSPHKIFSESPLLLVFNRKNVYIS